MAGDTDFSQFTRVLSDKVDAAVRQKVVPILNKAMNVNIRTNVYGAGNPKVYTRRKGKGGLEDSTNHMLKLEHNGVTFNTIDTIYTFQNETVSQGGGWNLKEGYMLTLEFGNNHPMYGTPDSWWNKPRPFISIMKTDDNLKQQISNAVIDYVVSSTDNAIYRSLKQMFRKYDGAVMTITYKY